jgi:hypothetical protein
MNLQLLSIFYGFSLLNFIIFPYSIGFLILSLDLSLHRNIIILFMINRINFIRWLLNLGRKYFLILKCYCFFLHSLVIFILIFSTIILWFPTISSKFRRRLFFSCYLSQDAIFFIIIFYLFFIVKDFRLFLFRKLIVSKIVIIASATLYFLSVFLSISI